MALTFNFANAMAFSKALSIALPHVQPLVDAIMTFDPMQVLSAFASMGNGLDSNVMTEFMKLGFKYGMFSFVANNVPFKREFSFMGITFRVI